MSATTTTARALEETFRPIVASALGGGFDVRLANTDLVRPAAPLRLPALILSAHDTGEFFGLKVAGRYAKLCQLRFEFRVAGAGEQSPQILEDFAARASAAFENATGITGWTYLRWDTPEDERTWEGSTRVLTRSYEVRCLTAA